MRNCKRKDRNQKRHRVERDWVVYMNSVEGVMLQADRPLLDRLTREIGDVWDAWAFLVASLKQCKPRLAGILRRYDYAQVEYFSQQPVKIDLHFLSDGRTAYVAADPLAPYDTEEE